MRGRPGQAYVRDEQTGVTSIMRDNYESQTRDTTENPGIGVQLSPPIDDPASSIPRHFVERPISVGDRLAELTISSPTATRPSSRLLSPDISLPSVEGADLITVRDLPNATPRPSPSPEPERSSALDTSSVINQDHYQDIEASDGRAGDLPNPKALSLGDDEAQFIPYNVDAEALPLNPCFDRDYQRAVKRATMLAGNVCTHLSQCEVANRVDSQLYKIKQRASQLNRFDSPASRTVAIVGDSAAGTSLLSSSLHFFNDSA